jgi:hypothetical protein
MPYNTEIVFFTQATKNVFSSWNFVSDIKYLNVHQEMFLKLFKIWLLDSRCIYTHEQEPECIFRFR